MAVVNCCPRPLEFLPCGISRFEQGMSLCLLGGGSGLAWFGRGWTQDIVPQGAAQCTFYCGGEEMASWMLLPFWTAEKVAMLGPVPQSCLFQHKVVSPSWDHWGNYHDSPLYFGCEDRALMN